MKKANLILIGLLVVQAGTLLATRLTSREAPSGAAVKGLLLSGLGADAVQRVVVEEGPGATLADAADGRVTLARGNGGWTVIERDGFPADAEKVDAMIRELTALEIADVVSTTGLHDSALKVSDADFGKRVTLTDASGDRVLLLGTSGRGGSTHARVAGDKRAVAVRNLTSWRVSGRPDGWLKRPVVDLDPEAVTALTLSWPDRTLTLAKADAGWTADAGTGSEPADEGAVMTLVRKASKVSLSKVLGPMNEAAEAPLLTVDVAAGDARARYRIFAGASDTTRVLRADGATHVVEIGQWAVSGLVEATVDAVRAQEAAVDEAPGVMTE